jgi:hypothetical protein
MHQAPLTQEVIDHGFSESEAESSRSKLATHPLIVGGVLLAGSGIVLAAAKLAHKRDHEKENAARRHGSRSH